MGSITTKSQDATQNSSQVNNTNIDYRPSTEDAIMNYQLDGYFHLAAIKCHRNSLRDTSLPEGTLNPIIQLDLQENSKNKQEISTSKVGTVQSGKSIKTISENKPSSEDGNEESRSPQASENKMTSQSDVSSSLVDKLEAMREKYKHVCMNRDQLLKRNFALNNDLKKTQAQITVRTKEAQKLVKQSQRESAQWKEFATAAQNENTVLIPEVEKLRNRLESIDPENLEIVKQYQDLLKKVKECQSELGKEREHRKRLQQVSAEIEIELEQEKVQAMFNAEAQEADFKSKRKNAKSYNASLLQRLEGLKLKLNSEKVRLDIVKSCNQIRRWLVEQGDKEKKPTELVRHGRRRASISKASSESTGSHRGSQKQSPRKDETVQDEMSAALNRIVNQTENEQTKFRSLYDQYLGVAKERDDAVKELASLQKRAEEEFSNCDLQNHENESGDDDSQPLIGPDFSESRSQMQQLQKTKPIRRSSGTLVAKIEILEMELRQKSRMIQYLERENADQLGNVIYSQDPSRPLKKWEHTRYEIFKGAGMDMGEGLEIGEISSEADDEQILSGEREVGSWGALLPDPASTRSKDDIFSVF